MKNVLIKEMEVITSVKCKMIDVLKSCKLETFVSCTVDYENYVRKRSYQNVLVMMKEISRLI